MRMELIEFERSGLRRRRIQVEMACLYLDWFGKTNRTSLRMPFVLCW